MISPLVSLMQDQVRAMKYELGIDARMLISVTDKEISRIILQDMTDDKSDMKLLYITPEKLEKSKKLAKKKDV